MWECNEPENKPWWWWCVGLGGGAGSLVGEGARVDARLDATIALARESTAVWESPVLRGVRRRGWSWLKAAVMEWVCSRDEPGNAGVRDCLMGIGAVLRASSEERRCSVRATGSGDGRGEGSTFSALPRRRAGGGVGLADCPTSGGSVDLAFGTLRAGVAPSFSGGLAGIFFAPSSNIGMG